ncbi:MAG: hypothetical protein ACREM6_00875, partial [Vulcanimicrobiaceae bacterium]
MRFASIAAWLCAPVVGLTVTALAVNVPMFDEWTWAPLVLAMHDGQLRAADLWAQQQAHRSVLPTALMLALARFDGWDVRIEAAVNLALALATQVLLWRLFARVPQTRRGPAFLVASLLLFSLLQSENWLWGFQLSWFAVNLFVVAVVALLCAPAAGRAAFTAAAVAAIGASLSLIFGFGAWVAGVVALVGRRRRLGVWIAIALALAGGFAIGYHPPRFENGWAHRAPLLDVPQFVLAYLGAPAGALGGRWVAEAAGLLLLIAWFR